jgi:hypothetical protein
MTAMNNDLRFPGTTARSLVALRVTDSRCDPVAVFLIVPFLGLLSIRVWDAGRFIIEPSFRLLSLSIDNLVRCVLIPISGLQSCQHMAQRNDGRCQVTFEALGSTIFFSSTQPEGFSSLGSSISLGGLTAGSKSSSRLPDFSLTPLNRTSKVLLLGLIVYGKGSVVFEQMSVVVDVLDNESVKVGQFLDTGLGRVFEVFLLVLAGKRVLVTEDEMKLERNVQYLLHK